MYHVSISLVTCLRGGSCCYGRDSIFLPLPLLCKDEDKPRRARSRDKTKKRRSQRSLKRCFGKKGSERTVPTEGPGAAAALAECMPCPPSQGRGAHEGPFSSKETGLPDG